MTDSMSHKPPAVDASGLVQASCIVNTYNRCDLLPRALASVYAQIATFAPHTLEVIVVDDASTDDTETVIREWQARFDAAGVHFVATRLAENSGYQCVPKNCGIELARGDYIRFLDDDNEWTDGSLRLLYDAIRTGDAWPDAVYGRREYVIDEGAPSTHPNGEVLPVGESELIEHDPMLLAMGPLYNYVDTGDILIARGVFWWAHEYTGMMWNPSRRRFGDWELVSRLSTLHTLVGVASARFKAVDAVVSRYHWTGTNLQMTRPVVETPEAVTITEWERHGKVRA